MVQTQSPFKTVMTRPYIAKAFQFKKAAAESLMQAMTQVFPGSVCKFGLDRYACICGGMPVEINEGDWVVYSTKYSAFHVFTDTQYRVQFTEPEDLEVVDFDPSAGVPLTIADLDADKPILLDEVSLMTDISIGQDLIDKSMMHITPLKHGSKPLTFGVTATNPGSVTPVLGLSMGGELITKGRFRELLKEATK